MSDSIPSPADAVRAALQLHRAGDIARAEQIYRQVLQTEPENAPALHYLGVIESGRGNFAEAEKLIAKSLSIKPDQASAWNNYGSCLVELGRNAEAMHAFREAIRHNPDYPNGIQNLARMLQRTGDVRGSIEAFERQLVVQPGNPTASFNIELCRRELAAENSARQSNPFGASEKWFSIIVVCYGDFPQYSVRCIDSLVATPDLLRHCELHVGCNVCSSRTIEPLRKHFDNGKITTLLTANRNLHKDPILRTMLGITKTPYALMLDDDTHMTDPGWLLAMLEFIEKNHPLDVAGDIYSINRDAEYQKLVEPKPWWRGVDVGHPAYKSLVFLATGGMVLARLGFLREHNFPDRSMIIWRDDAMLGDLTNQSGGKLLRYPASILQKVKINDGRRRGEDIMTVVPATPEDFSTGF